MTTLITSVTVSNPFIFVSDNILNKLEGWIVANLSGQFKSQELTLEGTTGKRKSTLAYFAPLPMAKVKFDNIDK